ncbi:trypsin-like serine protease [Rubrimonas cliftonensis]|nr:trypsin-like serine protease [Rubrimonas cliftonensis]
MSDAAALTKILGHVLTAADLAQRIAARSNDFDGLLAAFATARIADLGLSPDVVAAQFTARRPDATRPDVPASVLAAALTTIAMHAPASPAQEALRRVVAAEHEALGASGVNRSTLALIGLLLLLGGAEFSFGPLKLEVPGLIEVVAKIPAEDIDALYALLSSDAPPDAPYVSRPVLPAQGVPIDDARAIAREIDERFRSGAIMLPDLPSRSAAYPSVAAPWRPDNGSTTIGRYFIGAGVVYASTTDGRRCFLPSVTVFLPRPGDKVPQRVLLNLNPLKQALLRSARIHVELGGVVHGLGTSQARGHFPRLPVGCSVEHPSGLLGSVTCFARLTDGRHVLVTSGHVASDFGRTGAGTELRREDQARRQTGFATVVEAVMPKPGIGVGALDCDAALAMLHSDTRHDENYLVGGKQRIDTIGSVDPENMLVGRVVVMRHGCGSRPATGYVSSLDQTAFFAGPNGQVYEIADQMQIKTEPKAPAFAVAGDSGGPVMLSSSGDRVVLVGQVVCGNARGGLDGATFVTPALVLERRFGLKLVGASR